MNSQAYNHKKKTVQHHLLDNNVSSVQHYHKDILPISLCKILVKKKSLVKKKKKPKEYNKEQ